MTSQQREQSLITARRACLMLARYATGESPAALLGEEHREYLACLIEEFGRLDAKEQRAIKQSRANGAKSKGRPRKQAKQQA